MLFRKKVERYCAHCVFGGKVDDDTVICKKCGIVPAIHHCRRFRYDPLKRQPAPPSPCDFSQYQATDFSL